MSVPKPRQLIHLMRLVVSLANANMPYQHVINNPSRYMNNRPLNANNQRNYNTIRKGLNAIRAEVKKNNNRLNRMREAQVMQRKHRRATKVQAHVRGFLERRRQNKGRFVTVVGPNGKLSIAVVPSRASGFRAIAAKRVAERRNTNRMLQSFAN